MEKAVPSVCQVFFSQCQWSLCQQNIFVTNAPSPFSFQGRAGTGRQPSGIEFLETAAWKSWKGVERS